jgi:type I restriction-modification system DNA methylase subunit
MTTPGELNINKDKLSKDKPYLVESFVNSLNDSLKEIQRPLQRLFDAFRKGEINGEPRKIALKLFDEWSYRSLLPTVNETREFICKVINNRRIENGRIDVDKVSRELENKLPFDSKAVRKFVDSTIAMIMKSIGELREGAELEKKFNEVLKRVIDENIWDIYETTISTFLLQTAHVIVGRILLYRIGVDKGIIDEIPLPKSDPKSDKPFLKLYHEIRTNLEKLFPEIYALSEFDWWYVPDVYRGLIESKEQQILLNNIEKELDITLSRVFERFKRYDFSSIDRDVWKEVYLKFLPENERRKLGFIPTPDEIVELILDLVGYTENTPELCKRKLLDPACGSGTFLVEAVVRLRKHLEREMSCHKELYDRRLPEWERKKKILDIISNSIYGIDIHPFATFLTTSNIIFQLLDLYVDVKHYHPDFKLYLKIVTHDALVIHMPHEVFMKETAETSNSRLREAVRRSEEFTKILNQQFDYVVGNPPWGGVLKGKLGPLGDERKRKKYKNSFKSATGKFDIYVLFIERGLKWLKDGGVLGMITQITYLDSDFGKGIREYIKGNGTILYLIDLSEFGEIIFPSFTNYPAITVIRKEKPLDDAKFLRVKVSKGV